MIRVALDAMGGDRGPEEIVAGALAARTDDVVPVLVGPAGLDAQGLELIEAPDVIAMDEKPTEAVRAKPDSSLVRACRAVAEGDADVVVSAGNTGAMLAAGLLELRRLPGVQRPAAAVPLPTIGAPSVMLDCGANADAVNTRTERTVRSVKTNLLWFSLDSREVMSGTLNTCNGGLRARERITLSEGQFCRLVLTSVNRPVRR